MAEAEKEDAEAVLEADIFDADGLVRRNAYDEAITQGILQRADESNFRGKKVEVLNKLLTTGSSQPLSTLKWIKISRLFLDLFRHLMTSISTGFLKYSQSYFLPDKPCGDIFEGVLKELKRLKLFFILNPIKLLVLTIWTVE